jgi:hypothetical protein
MFHTIIETIFLNLKNHIIINLIIIIQIEIEIEINYFH